MSSTPLWIIVEGRYHDRAYYDRLLQSLPLLENVEYEILLAEFTSVGNIAAGGKKHAFRLHEEMARNSWLRQRSNATNHVIIFALDRDLDDEPKAQLPDDLHIIYTKFADVEAEILDSGDLSEALVNASGTTRRDIQRLPSSIHKPLEFLAIRWEEWLSWGLALRETNPNPIQTRSASLINEEKFGELSEELLAIHSTRIGRVVGVEIWEAQLLSAKIALAELKRQNKIQRLVTGKWAAKFVIDGAKTNLGASGLPADLDENDLLRAMLSTVILSPQNRKRYSDRISDLFKIEDA